MNLRIIKRGTVLLSCYSVFDSSWIFHAPRRIKYLHADNIAVLIKIKYHAGLFFIAFLDRRTAENDADNIDFGVIGYLSWPPPFAGLTVSLTIILTR